MGSSLISMGANSAASFSNPLEVSLHPGSFYLGALNPYGKSPGTPTLASSGLHPAKKLFQQQEWRDSENIRPPCFRLESEDRKRTEQTTI